MIDVIEALSESPNPRNYWNMLKKREPQLYTICVQLKLVSSDGKKVVSSDNFKKKLPDAEAPKGVD